MTQWRIAFRSLVRRPAFALTIVAVLAFGIGANSAVFSIVDTVLLKPLPYRNPDRIVTVSDGNPAKNQRESLVSPARLADWNRLSTTFETISGLYVENATDTSLSQPERLSGWRVAPGFFNVFSTRPLLGRTFLPSEEKFGAPQVAVISEALWNRRYHRNPNVIGTRLRLAGVTCTVVGILPKSFARATVDLWMPAQIEPKVLDMREARFYSGVGRMKPGVTIERAQADVRRVCLRLGELYPRTDKGWSPIIESYKQHRIGKESRPLSFVFAAVSLLLLILCANIAGLLLGQWQRRERELAIRSSLGAKRREIAAVIFREIGLLTSVGAALGLLLAYTSTKWMAHLFSNIPRIEELRFDARIALFTIALGAATAFVFGLLPAIQGSRRDLNARLARAGRSHAGGRHPWQQLLVGAQFAVTVVLLAGAGLLLRSYYNLTRVQPGFDPSNIVTFHVGAGWDEDRAKIGLMQAQLIDQLAQVPGVKAAGLTNALPASGANLREQVSVEGLPQAGNDGQITAGTRSVSEGYLRALRIPLLEGAFCPAFRMDPHPSPSVAKVMVNERFVQLAGTPDVLGRHLTWTNIPSFAPSEIVGVLGNVHEDALNAPAVPYVYLCTPPGLWADADYVVGAGGNTRGIENAVRKVVHRIAPDRAIFGLTTMSEYLDGTLDQPRLTAGLLGAFAASALLSAALGLYGLVLLMIASRVREFGLRMALGAAPLTIAKEVIASAIRPLVPAAIVGLILAFVLLRAFRSVFFEVAPSDLGTFSFVCALLLAVALLAALLPSRRAARIDPMQALRSE